MPALARSAPRIRSLCLAVALAGVASMLAHGLFSAGPNPSPPPVAHALTPTGGLALLPPAARGVVSASLGAQMPGYRLAGLGAAAIARNPSQGIRGEFGNTGAALTSGRLRLRLGPAVIGTVATEGASRAVAANRITYSRGPVREWFVNGPAGIEQGFTITRALGPRLMGSPSPSRARARRSPLTGDRSTSAARGPRPSPTPT